MDNTEVIAAMKHYIDTYQDQLGWKQYSKETMLADLVYGIGIAMDRDKYEFADGYNEFKKDLIEFLTNPDE